MCTEQCAPGRLPDAHEPNTHCNERHCAESVSRLPRPRFLPAQSAAHWCSVTEPRSLKPFSWKSLHVLLHSIYDSIHKQYFLTHAIIYIYDIYGNITQYLRYFPSIDKSVQSKQDSKILNQLKSATPPRLESQHKWCYQKVLPLTLVFSFIA